MPAEPGTARRALGPIRSVPTPTGAALLVAAFFAGVMSVNQRVAIGFLIPLAGLMVVDGLISRRWLGTTSVNVTAVRRIAAAPEPLTFSATRATGRGELGLRLGRSGRYRKKQALRGIDTFHVRFS